MRILLVGTDLAPVHAEGGALELLLAGWADALAGEHQVWVATIPGGPILDAQVTFERPEELAGVVERLAPDVVVLNNRPGWQHHVDGPTVHLLHNWPDAWGLGPGGLPPLGPPPLGPPPLGRAVVAAVSSALASAASEALGGSPAVVVDPWVHGAFLTAVPEPEPGLVLCPNRLMAKKGIAELCVAASRPALAGARILVTDHLSPWSTPTAEHVALRALVRASPRCRLIPPARSRTAMARLYAAASAAVCPSVRPEGLGLSAIEAQACGVPVASSGLGGLAESTLLPELIADPGDPDELAGAVAAAMAVPAAARRALRTKVAARFGIEASSRSLLAAIERAVAPVPDRPVGRGAPERW